MRKIFLSIMLVITLLLVGCTDRTHYFNYDEMVDKVIKIEIVDMVSTSSDKSNVLKELDDSLIDDFLLDLSKIKFTKPIPIANLSTPSGKSFCVYYNDNNYDIINYLATSIGTFPDARCSKEEFNKLIYKYYRPDAILIL